MRFLECLKSAGKILHGNKLSLVNDEEVISLSHAKVYVFSDSVLRLGKMNQSEPNIEQHLRTLNIGLTICGRARWKEAEATRNDFNTVLIRQDKRFFTSELFKAIQDATPLILHFRTMCLFRTVSSSTFIILDVQSVYTPSQIQD